MSLNTFSKFIYGFDVTDNNRYIDFNEGSGELTATLNVGSYTLTELIAEVQNQMNATGVFTYTVSVNRTTRVITITSDSAMILLFGTGTNLERSASTLLGYDVSDTSSATSHVADSAIGYVYEPQFILQNYISDDDYQVSIDSVVNESTEGELEVIKFGTKKFIEMNIMYATNNSMDGKIIKNNASGVANLRSFMQFIVEKKRLEFIPDESNMSTFKKIILERTDEDSKGTGYKLKELYDKGLPGFYETGTLKFRVIA